MTLTIAKNTGEIFTGVNLTTLTTTASIIPVAGTLQVASFTLFGGSVGLTGVPLVTGNGFSWTAVALKSRLSISVNRWTFTYVLAVTPGAVTGPVTLIMSGTNNFTTTAITATTISGVNLLGGTIIRQIVTLGEDAGGGNTMTIPLSSSYDNALFGQYSVFDGGFTPTARDNWTQLDYLNSVGELGHQIQWLPNTDNAGSVTWDSNSSRAGVVMEIVSATNGTQISANPLKSQIFINDGRGSPIKIHS